MGRKIGEDEITWSCIDKYNDYYKVVWGVDKNDIPTYMLLNEEGSKISIKTEW